MLRYLWLLEDSVVESRDDGWIPRQEGDIARLGSTFNKVTHLEVLDTPVL